MIPTPLSPWQLLLYRLTLPLRLKRQAIIRQARSAAAIRGWQARRVK